MSIMDDIMKAANKGVRSAATGVEDLVNYPSAASKAGYFFNPFNPPATPKPAAPTQGATPMKGVIRQPIPGTTSTPVSQFPEPAKSQVMALLGMQTAQAAAPTLPSTQIEEQQPNTSTQGQSPYDYFMNNVNHFASTKGINKKDVQVPDDLKSAVTAASQKYNVPADMLYAIAQQESSMGQNMVQPNGKGRGYFQIDLGQHPDVTEKQAMDPNFAADFAAQLISNNLKTYSNTKSPVSNAIKAYNGRITLPSSAKYLDGILTNLENLKFQ